MFEWETGETSYEPLSLIVKDDPITWAAYAKRNGLLDLPGWKFLKQYAKTSKSFINVAKQSRIRHV